MFESTSRNLRLLTGSAGVILCLGVGTAAGVVPQVGTSETVASAQAADATPSQPIAPDTAGVTTNQAAPPDTAPATTATPTTVRRAPSTSVAPPRPKAAASVAAPAAAPAAAAPAAPAKATRAARLNPSSAQVQAALGQFPGSLLFKPTEAQARDFANQVCTAFDQGSSYAAVRSQVVQALSTVPLLQVTPAQIDGAIHTAVTLFCPGYASLLR